MRAKNLLIGVLLGTALAAGIWLALATLPMAPESKPASATILPAKIGLPAVSLVDQHGNAIDEQVFEGQWDLVFFGFTQCPDVCPMTLSVLSAARQHLLDAGQTPVPRIVLVSVDPERDTPDRMSAYMSNFGRDNLGVTGNLDQIRTLTDALGIFFEKRRNGGELYSVDHSAAVLLIDPDGRFRAIFGSPHKLENFVNDLPLLMQT